MWKIVQGSQDVKPSEVDTTSSSVYIYQRRNIERITVENMDGSTADFWQYEERKLTHDEYRILQLEDENTNLQLALTELYEQILEG